MFKGEFPASELNLQPGHKYKLHIQGKHGDWFDRIPAYARYCLQDPDNHSFSGCHFESEYEMSQNKPNFNESLKIYECHVGMSSPEAKIATYKEFTETTLPFIKSMGYNAIQLMAVPEHAYYGSFGYHVTNYFASSSRFGTPDDLKKVSNFFL